MNLQTLKGFRDFLPQEARKRQYVINIFKQIFESFGFEPLETPTLEYDELLTGKYGEEGEKLMYRFEDHGKRKVAMRYDQTVPLARVVAQYQNSLAMPFKRYQIQNVWRADNTQKGRFREFVQCDIDTIGTYSFRADAEIIYCVIQAIRKLGFKNTKILINDRFQFGTLKPQFVAAIDKLEKIGKEGVIKELCLKGMSQSDAEKYVNSFDNSKPVPNVLTIFKFLNELGLTENKDFIFKSSLARGLDYYTASIFELISDEYKVGSLGGGGRYDKLIGMFSGTQIPAVGFAFGFDRIIEAMDQLKLFPQDILSSPSKVLVTIFNKDLEGKSLELSSRLRSNNINTEIWVGEIKDKNPLEKQLKYANEKGIPFVIILGPEEIAKNIVILRDMRKREQKECSFDELLKILQK